MTRLFLLSDIILILFCLVIVFLGLLEPLNHNMKNSTNVLQMFNCNRDYRKRLKPKCFPVKLAKYTVLEI